jgi:hypothetical protein
MTLWNHPPLHASDPPAPATTKQQGLSGMDEREPHLSGAEQQVDSGEAAPPTPLEGGQMGSAVGPEPLALKPQASDAESRSQVADHEQSEAVIPKQQEQGRSSDWSPAGIGAGGDEEQREGQGVGQEMQQDEQGSPCTCSEPQTLKAEEHEEEGTHARQRPGATRPAGVPRTTRLQVCTPMFAAAATC